MWKISYALTEAETARINRAYPFAKGVPFEVGHVFVVDSPEPPIIARDGSTRILLPIKQEDHDAGLRVLGRYHDSNTLDWIEWKEVP